MRKLKLQMQVSLDGFVGGPQGDLDWMEWNWGDELNKYVSEITELVDTILLGRKLAEGFIPYWADAGKNPEHPEFPFAKKINDTPKIVFSKTLKNADWENTSLANGNLVEEIHALKNKTGNDIIVYGGAEFVTNLLRDELIDEYHLFINPVAIGNGLTIFKGLEKRLNLNLIYSKSFPCGIVGFHYEPK